MTGVDFPVGLGPDDGKRSAFDYATKLLLPALSLIALIFAERSGKQPKLVWVLAGLTIVFVLVGFSPSLAMRIRGWVERRRDEQAGKRVLPKFRAFVHGFGRFVDTRFGDTLHSILQSEMCQGRGDQFDKLGIPNLQLWYGFSQHLIWRVDRQQLNASEFAFLLQEFHHLVGAYNNYCAAPIFERFPRDFQTALTPEVRRSLNGFQQRFVHFLQEYQEFETQVAESRPAFKDLPRGFSLPKPL
jgi:hypothetical protein